MDRNWHLSTKDFFEGMPEERAAFLAIARHRNLRKGEMIFLAGDPGHSCFYIQRGVVRIFGNSASGKESVFFLRKSGEIFGLAEVLDSMSRKANAQALTPCILYDVEKTVLEDFLAANFRVARTIITTLGRRVRYLGEQVANLMTCDVGARLAKLLVYVAYDQLPDEKSWHEPVEVDIGLTQDQMAAMIGSCQQTVSEVLRSFQDKGLIRIKNRRIQAIHPMRLMHEAGD